MFGRRRPQFWLAAIVAIVNFAASPAWPDGAAPVQTANRVRLPDGRRINLLCSGSGSPTVIFEGGYAADSGAWWKVRPEVAKTQRACAYDRAGYGASDAGPEPRDGAAVAMDLDATLRAAKIARPYVVVGHSAGALYLRLFAARRSRDVVGMVLVDPSIEHQDRRLAAVFGPGAGSLKGAHDRAVLCLAAAVKHLLPSADSALKICGATTSAANWQTQKSEADTLWGATSDQIDASHLSYGAIPIIVLTAEGTYASTPQQARSTAEALWSQWHRELAALSSRGQERTVSNTSHMIMIDRPDAVVAAIREVVALATDRRGEGRPVD